MSAPSLSEALASLPMGGVLTLSLQDIPLDELLFRLHTGRFTGALSVHAGTAPDRIYFREGVAVGVVPDPEQDVARYGQLLVQMKLLSQETLSAVWADFGPEDGVALERVLLENELLTAQQLTRGAEEHARRRLFALYDFPEAQIEVRSGLESLAHFSPIYLDVRPAIAFGLVVRADADRKGRLAQQVQGRRVRLLAPYDEGRNSYGLPPPVLLALRDLAEGVHMRQDVRLPGLSASETAGVLLLFQRMSLLTVS